MHTGDAARRTPSPQVTDTEPIIDMRKLRTYRLTRLRAEMAKHEVPACVLFNPISVRYASGFRDSAPFATPPRAFDLRHSKLAIERGVVPGSVPAGNSSSSLQLTQGAVSYTCSCQEVSTLRRAKS